MNATLYRAQRYAWAERNSIWRDFKYK